MAISAVIVITFFLLVLTGCTYINDFWWFFLMPFIYLMANSVVIAVVVLYQDSKNVVRDKLD